jgi:hypothetical protein
VACSQSNRGIDEVMVAVDMAMVVVAEAVDGIDDSISTRLPAAATAALLVAGDAAMPEARVRSVAMPKAGEEHVPCRMRERGVRSAGPRAMPEAKANNGKGHCAVLLCGGD